MKRENALNSDSTVTDLHDGELQAVVVHRAISMVGFLIPHLRRKFSDSRLIILQNTE